MINNTNRTLGAIAGAERSGKTYQTEQRANHYAKHRGPVIVYNAGRETDFSDYEYIEILEPDDVCDLFPMEKYARRRFLRKGLITHFKYRGRVFHFRQFNLIFADRGNGAGRVKMFRLTEPKHEERFFEAVLLYISGALLVIDDARPITSRGVKPRLTALLLKKNHAGRKSIWKRNEHHLLGVDILMIYHNLAKISSEIYDYITEIIIFKSNQRPKDNIDNDDLIPIIKDAWEYLQDAPKYTSIKVHVKGPKANTAEIINPQITRQLCS